MVQVFVCSFAIFQPLNVFPSERGVKPGSAANKVEAAESKAKKDNKMCFMKADFTRTSRGFTIISSIWSRMVAGIPSLDKPETIGEGLRICEQESGEWRID